MADNHFIKEGDGITLSTFKSKDGGVTKVPYHYALIAPYTYTDRSSSTSPTASVWTVIAASNVSRKEIIIENTSTSVALIIGFGATGSEIVLAGGTIAPGSATSGNNTLQTSSTQQINIKSAAVSVAFTATEAIYS